MNLESGTENLKDDFSLLHHMLTDMGSWPSKYQPGPYWARKAKNAFAEIKKNGISDFRGATNGIANSYGDNAIVDLMASYNSGLRQILKFLMTRIFPLSVIHRNQVQMTRHYFNELIAYKNTYLVNLDRVKYLTERYRLPDDSTRGGCIACCELQGKMFSHHYLQLLDTLDHVAVKTNLSSIFSMFEIGGGFGANVHLSLELFPNIKKVLYLDIAPNLYVGTQYLKSFYGNSVIDYSQTRERKEIIFSDNEQLEIICITPNQIELFKSTIDWFHNASSFVEMPPTVVANYAEFIQKLLSGPKIISLVSYDQYDDHSIAPDNLPQFFNMPFIKETISTLTPDRFNFHYLHS